MYFKNDIARLSDLQNPSKTTDIGEKLAPPDVDFLSLNMLDWHPST